MKFITYNLVGIMQATFKKAAVAIKSEKLNFNSQEMLQISGKKLSHLKRRFKKTK
jgi:hypothetical protein